jgi:Glycosyltransferase family 87
LQTTDSTTGVLRPRPALNYPERGYSSRARSTYRAELVKVTGAMGGAAALSLMVLSSLVLVSLAATRPSWLSPLSKLGYNPSWLAGPLGPLTGWLNVGSGSISDVFTVLIAAMYISYVVVVAAAPHLSARWAISAVVLVHIIFFLGPPMHLTDAFNYVNYARMDVVHGLNPYTTIPALEPHSDPTFLLSNWHGLLSPYGPLFTVFMFALVQLGVAGSLWALKATLLLFALGILWLVWRCAELVGRPPLAAVLFVGLNPLVLVWGLGGAHNDFYMMFLIVLAVYLLLRVTAPQRPPGTAVGAPEIGIAGPVRDHLEIGWIVPCAVGAGVAIAAAVAIKASSVILLPIFVFGLARRLRVGFSFVVGLAVAFIGVAVMTLLVFGAHLPNISQQDGLIDENSIPNVIGYVIGLGGETKGLHLVLTVVLVLGVLACAVWAARTEEWLTAAGYATLLVLLTLSWTLPSYVLWLLPFAALARPRALRVATVVFGVYVLLFWMPYSNSLDVFFHLRLSSTTVAHTAANYQHGLQF